MNFGRKWLTTHLRSQQRDGDARPRRRKAAHVQRLALLQHRPVPEVGVQPEGLGWDGRAAGRRSR